MVASRNATVCRVTQYAKRVVSGDIVAGRLVRLACERHLRDLKEGPRRGLRWSQEDADNAIEFFSFLRLPVDGELDGKAFDLEPFQMFIVGSIFGWKGQDGYRRFRTAYVEMGKGNGKTPMAAGIGLKGMADDGEAAAEIYSAATKREQANILFRDARRMVEASPELRAIFSISAGNIAFEDKDSFFRPVSSEKRGLDGTRPHIALLDEVHEHPDAVVVDKMRAGTKGRRQALVFEITNSGYDRTTVCWHHHEFSRAVLEGSIENDSWFAFVCNLDPCDAHQHEGHWQPVDGCDECDSWLDESCWAKANPGINTILPSKYLREQVAEAKEILPKQNIVKRLNFCIWTDAADHAIPMDSWDACGDDLSIEDFHGRECYGALDIGATSDFTAFALVFPHDDAESVEVIVNGEKQSMVRRSFTFFQWFWMPEKPCKRDARTQEVIDLWKRQGFIKETGDNSVDYDLVLKDVLSIIEPFTLCGFAFDRGFQGGQMGTNLMKYLGEELVEQFPQGIISMNAPFREILELLKLKRLKHDRNPVMRWMASNTSSEERGGLIKPSKDKSVEKIDGIAALTMAMGLAIRGNQNPPSIYETRGILQVGVHSDITGNNFEEGVKPVREYNWQEF